MENLTNNLTGVSETLVNNADMKPLMDIINSVMELPDDMLTEEVIESMVGMVNGAITPRLRKQMVESVIENFRTGAYSRSEALQDLEVSKQSMKDFIAELNPSTAKKEILDEIFQIFYDIFDQAGEKYLAYDIVLPMTLEGDAKIPTYAHETDAAADLYALETVTVTANSRGNMIRTGVRIALPENWVAYIVPRSSIGTKTPLRLSNSVGVIDAGYRGELYILYDNISDSDYTITAGDRIAQLIVMPSYHFKAEVADILDTTERGEGGFGSSGN